MYVNNGKSRSGIINMDNAIINSMYGIVTAQLYLRTSDSVTVH